MFSCRYCGRANDNAYRNPVSGVTTASPTLVSTNQQGCTSAKVSAQHGHTSAEPEDRAASLCEDDADRLDRVCPSLQVKLKAPQSSEPHDERTSSLQTDKGWIDDVAADHTAFMIRHSCDKPTAVIIEDIRQAEMQLSGIGYTCERITHNELMATSGTEYLGKLLKGEYSLLWISTPNDWFVRTPNKRTTPHWERILHWLNICLLYTSPSPRDS